MTARLSLRVGDLFTSGAPAIGHGVNVSGVMGAGVARVVRERFPDCHLDYYRHCRTGRLRPGGVHIWQPTRSGEPMIVNLATQDLPGPNARLWWVRQSMRRALAELAELGVDRLAIPRIGCGIGGLTFPDVLGVLDSAVGAQQAVAVEVWALQSDLNTVAGAALPSIAGW